MPGHGGGKKAQSVESSGPSATGGEGSHGGKAKGNAEVKAPSGAPTGAGPGAPGSEGKKGKSEGAGKPDKKAGEATASPTP